MYIILVYDFGERRVGKILKLCRQYLNRVQNSVFEGEITPSKLLELTTRVANFMDEEADSIIIFKSSDVKWLDKTVIGKQVNDLNTII